MESFTYIFVEVSKIRMQQYISTRYYAACSITFMRSHMAQGANIFMALVVNNLIVPMEHPPINFP